MAYYKGVGFGIHLKIGVVACKLKIVFVVVSMVVVGMIMAATACHSQTQKQCYYYKIHFFHCTAVLMLMVATFGMQMSFGTFLVYFERFLLRLMFVVAVVRMFVAFVIVGLMAVVAVVRVFVTFVAVCMFAAFAMCVRFAAIVAACKKHYYRNS